MILTIFQPIQASPAEFISYWAPRYFYPREHLYNDNIGRPLNNDSIQALYVWKNDMDPIAAGKQQSIDRHFKARAHELSLLPATTTAAEFLRIFSRGGAIWRIFWLHCWQPDRFPIYDQHVHRAMTRISSGRIEEIPHDDDDKIEVYLNSYLAFHAQFSGSPSRDVDKALWAYGRFLKIANLPHQ